MRCGPTMVIQLLIIQDDHIFVANA